MKKLEERKTLQSLDVNGLSEKVQSLQHELMNLRFRHQAGQLAQSAQLKNVRRQIARAQTELNSRERQ